MSFDISVCNKLFMTLSNAGVEPDEAVAFFGQQTLAMQSCPPNYGKHTDNKNMRLNYYSNFWIMRGFFPDTSVMFKIVMLKTSEDQFYSKVTMPPVTLYKKFGPPTTMVSKSMFDTIMNEKTNQILVGDNIDPKITIKQRTPKCMSPKGAPIHNLKKKKKTNG